MKRTPLSTVKNISGIFNKPLIYMILFLGFFSLLVVQPTNTEAAREHLTITEVFVDLDSETIEISGANFNLGPNDIVVTLGDFGELFINVLIPDFIVVEFPPGLVDGDYLLKVYSGPGSRKQDERTITIGAVGPQGDTGDPGGIQGTQGGYRGPRGKQVRLDLLDLPVLMELLVLMEPTVQPEQTVLPAGTPLLLMEYVMQLKI